MKIFLTAIFVLVNASAFGADCKSIQVAADRLQCFDSEAKPQTVAPAEQTTKPAPIEVRIVDPADLLVEEKRYYDRDIGMKNMTCYFAGIGDYRCSDARTDTLVAIFANAVEPKEAQEFINNNCDTIKKVTASNRCTMNIRFRYGKSEALTDIVSGYRQRLIIRPRAAVSIIFEKEIQRR